MISVPVTDKTVSALIQINLPKFVCGGNHKLVKACKMFFEIQCVIGGAANNERL